MAGAYGAFDTTLNTGPDADADELAQLKLMDEPGSGLAEASCFAVLIMWVLCRFLVYVVLKDRCMSI